MADNPQAAEMILDKMMQSLPYLENFPNSGASLLERSLKKFNFRMVIVDSYIAYYRFIENKILVYRILHGARHYSTLLKEAMK